MKAELEVDPRAYDAGPASPAIAQLCDVWLAIDWFAPAVVGDDVARQLFVEHQHRAYASTRIAIEIARGDAAAFADWCTRVRTQSGWDWKMSILKVLSHDHARAHRWTPEAHVARYGAGALFYHYEPAFLGWRTFAPRLDGEHAGFYAGYAHADLLDAFKWQLAEGHSDIAGAGNPFAPLVELYRAGFYPFSLARDRVVLFAFAETANTAAVQ